jgi:hypothetical protein
MTPPRIPLELLRGILLLLCLFFAYQFGRAVVGARRGDRRARPYGWAIRTVLTGAALAWRHPLDLTVIGAWVLAAAAFALGAWMAARPQAPEEDLTKEIFRD